MHSHDHIYKHKQKAWKQHAGPCLMFFDGKQSAKTERNHLTERENVTVCILRPCTFDTCEWGSVIEAYFEGKGRTNNQGLFLKTQRNFGTRCSFWLKTNWFYYQCHLTWSYTPRGMGGLWFFWYAWTKIAFISKKFVFPNCSNVMLKIILSWADQDSFCFSLTFRPGVGLSWSWLPNRAWGLLGCCRESSTVYHYQLSMASK